MTAPVDLARRGVGPYPCSRIPALARLRSGDLLAAFDGRPSMADLPAPISVVTRRSTDGGRTWGPLVTVCSGPAPQAYGDPSLLVDHEAGRVLMAYTASTGAGFADADDTRDPAAVTTLHPELGISDDDGRTWTHRRLTGMLRRPGDRGHFAASGHGIQLRHEQHRGRLLQTYVVGRSDGVFVMVARSDDHGETWWPGPLIGPGADESKVVELSDGTIRLDVRARPCRRYALSADGGETFGPLLADPALIDPANNADVIRLYPEAGPGTPQARILVHSHTEHPALRRNLVVSVSCDDGLSWRRSRVIEPGPAGYSCLAVLADGDLGLLYERSSYDALSFVRLDREQLLAGAWDCSTDPQQPPSRAAVAFEMEAILDSVWRARNPDGVERRDLVGAELWVQLALANRGSTPIEDVEIVDGHGRRAAVGALLPGEVRAVNEPALRPVLTPGQLAEGRWCETYRATGRDREGPRWASARLCVSLTMAEDENTEQPGADR